MCTQVQANFRSCRWRAHVRQKEEKVSTRKWITMNSNRMVVIKIKSDWGKRENKKRCVETSLKWQNGQQQDDGQWSDACLFNFVFLLFLYFIRSFILFSCAGLNKIRKTTRQPHSICSNLFSLARFTAHAPSHTHNIYQRYRNEKHMGVQTQFN